MENYTIIDTSVHANEGYIFVKKDEPDSIARSMDINLLPFYDCVLEPQIESEDEIITKTLEERVQKLEEDKEPLEAQAAFTAIMTDTLLEEEEEEE